MDRREEFMDKVTSPAGKSPVIFSRSLDTALLEVIDLFLRDYISTWLKGLTTHHKQLIAVLRRDFQTVLSNLQERATRVDYVKFITTDMVCHVTQHFEKIRTAQASVECKGNNKLPVFLLSPHLCTREGEVEYLRRISELLVAILIPKHYTQCKPLYKLLTEITACSMLQPCIDLLCDPDYINLKLVHIIEQHREATEQHHKTYTYAASYEDFIRMIQECSSIDDLKHIRYNIMTEIMQATTISNLKKAKGLDPDKELIVQGTGKADLLQARNLKRYINQLTLAKSQCEKRLKALGWLGLSAEPNNELLPGKKVLSFHVIMESSFTRRHLYQYLEQQKQQGLLGFWAAVEELRHVDKKLWHQLGAEIFYTYIHSPVRGIKVDKSTLKRMESFLMGDRGPEVFYEVQEDVLKILETKHYPSFLVSDAYHRMLMVAEETGVDFMQQKSQEESNNDESSTDGAASTLQLSDHSNYARRRLDQIDERLTNKTQALEALQSSLKSDTKILSVLEHEVQGLRSERRQLEVHLERTETWGEFLGKWNARVYSVEVPEEKEPPQFVLLVHLPGEGSTSQQQVEEEEFPIRWLVSRKLTDFQELHRKLSQYGSSVKSLELPSCGKSLFSKGSDKATLEKAKAQLQKYLDFILHDEKLNTSEAIYAFLSPSPEHLKHPVPSPKKPKFSFTTLFKSSSSGEGKDGSKDSDDEDCLLLEDLLDSSKGEDRKDSIAEPLYALLGEVFDMRGVFKLLRRTLITFVQITYGRTINRQLRETVDWLLSESMVLYYVNHFKKSWWPGGQLAPSASPRSDDQKTKTRNEARKQVLDNIPEVLCNLVGQQSGRRGVSKVFETIQDTRLNKQLFYNVLESFIYEFCPELKKHNEGN